MPDRRGVSGGEIVDCAGPWRTSGHWWDDPAPDTGATPSAASAPWDRDEWDVVLADGASCRVYLEREVGQWFIEGTASTSGARDSGLGDSGTNTMTLDSLVSRSRSMEDERCDWPKSATGQ